MAGFRKKPVVIEAYCYNQQPENYRPDWFQDRVSDNTVVTYPDHAVIRTIEGEMRADLGDWIIRGVDGELTICDMEDFGALYERMATVPAGYGRLPDGVVCKCMKLWKAEDGAYYCCLGAA